MKNIFTKFKRKRGRRKGRKKRIRSVSYKKTVKSSGIKIHKKYLNFAVLIIFLTFVLFSLWWIGSLFVQYNSISFEPAIRDETDTNQEWNREDRINILVVGVDRREGEYGFTDLLMLVMIDPSENVVGVFNINPDIAVFHEYSDKITKLRNVYNLGVINPDIVPIDSLKSEVESLLSLKIDRYIMLNEQDVIELVDVLGGVYVNNDKNLSDSEIANFSLREGSYRISGDDFLNFVRADDDGVDKKLERQIEATSGFVKRSVSYIAIFKSKMLLSVLEKSVRTDISKKEMSNIAVEFIQLSQIRTGYTRSSSLQLQQDTQDEDFLIPIEEELDKNIQQVFVSSQARLEQARVEVFNATDINGLASFRARWLSNMGLDIIRIGDIGQVYNKTTIFVREENKYPETVNVIKKSFREEVELNQGEVPDIVSTGDIIVILGENIKNS